VTSGIPDFQGIAINNSRRGAHAVNVCREPRVFDEILRALLVNEASVDRPHGGEPKPDEKVGRALTARPTDIVLVFATSSRPRRRRSR
jgi:hypothetical protein